MDMSKNNSPDSQKRIWYLEKLVNRNDKEKYSIEINTFPFHIGRKENCDLSLPSPYISKYHAVIIKEDNFLKIVDLESVNGIYVNYKRSKRPTVLKSGDILHFNKLFDETIAFRVIAIDITSNDTNNISRSLQRRKSTIQGKDFEFPVGLSLYLEIEDRKINHVKARLFAIEREKSLIINISQLEEIQFKGEEKCLVRFSYNNKIFGFETIIQKIESFSFPRLYLKYPETISCIAYRKHTRYQTNLKATVRTSFNDKLFPCRVIDISLGGCRVSFPCEHKPNLEKEFFLTLKHLVNDIRVLKVHDKMTEDAYEAGLKIISFGGEGKKKKYQEILDFHAPVKHKQSKQSI
jgi:hypothetical protein